MRSRRLTRLALVLALPASVTIGCTTLLGYPDRGPPMEDVVPSPDGSSVPDVDGAMPEPDAAMPIPDAGPDAREAGCTGTCPVAAYDFEEEAGTTTRDTSGNKNHGTLTGATFVAGKVGGAVSFNGTNYKVEAPSSASLDIAGTHLSLVFWAFVVDNLTHDHVLIDKPWTAGAMAPPYYQYGVEFSTGGKTFNFFLGTADSAAGQHTLGISAGPASTWTHVAFTYDGTTMRGYRDGVAGATLAATGSILARGTPFRLGVDGLNQQGFSGMLDSVRIFDKTLTVQEIIALRDAK